MDFILDSLTDEELQTLIDSVDISVFLEPIKMFPKQYRQYDSMLGSKNKKSPLVKKYLPGIVIKLIHNKDKGFVKLIEDIAHKQAEMLVDNMSALVNKEITSKDLQKYSDEELAEIINLSKDADDITFDWNLFSLQMKMNGCLDIDERKESISALAGLNNKDDIFDEISEPEIETAVEQLWEDENNDETASVKNVSTKVKHKKLSPQEKAARNKAALEAKEKAAKETEIDQEEASLEAPDDVNHLEEMIEETAKKETHIIKAEDDMQNTKYIGVINIISNFYNYLPIGKYENGEYYPLSEVELDELLPQSQKHNINFFYNVWDSKHTEFMRDHFSENQPMVLDFDLDDLEENRTAEGVINPTGYKISAIDGYKSGVISSPSGAGLYRLLSKDDLLDDIETKKAIRINHENLMDGEKVLVNLKDGFYAGPFTVKYSPTSYTYHIVMQAEEGKHYIIGYNSIDCNKVKVEASMDFERIIGYRDWTYYTINNDAERVVRDYISDKDLLESLKTAIDKYNDLDYSNLDIEDIISRIGTSQIVGDSLPEEIKKTRIERIKKIMTDEETIKQLYSEASDLISELLLSNKESMQTEQLITSILEKRPELLEKVQGVRAIQTKLDSARAELESLKAQKAEATEEIRKIREDASAKSSPDFISDNLSIEISEKNEELDDIMSKINFAKEVVDLHQKLEELKKEVAYYEDHKTHLQNDAKNLESNFVELVNGYSERMADITFDGFMSSKMLQAAAEWENKNDQMKLNEMVDSINEMESKIAAGEDLVDYIVDIVSSVRPGYEKNDIVNIMTCAVQGFLTVFSGVPGCGKTSICNIIAKTLGLNDYGKLSEKLSDISRYLPVSVERGWTSKRDLIGYYNPLTKAFEESNREVYDGLKLLDSEVAKKYNKWPFYILLDEANLSPMEYYWADFMNVCDDIKDNCTINLGNNNVFKIPETLHFLATINNDHTTETLSPRLIDRAWVITLPKTSEILSNPVIDDSTISNISWTSLKETFGADKSSTEGFNRETQLLYEGLKERFKEQDIIISPRVDIAIINYWRKAKELMIEDEYGNASELIALDYAISQKILPKIVGVGEEYETWLESLKTFCDSKNLNHTVDLLSEIIKRGNRKMKYYQFFN